MHDAVAYKLCILQRRDHGENTPLLRESKVRLEADDIIESPLRIVFSQLYDRIVFFPAARVDQSDRLHRAVPQRFFAAPRHHFDRHTSLEYPAVVKSVHRRFLRIDQLLPEREILLFRQRAVYIIFCALIVS